MLTKQMLEMAVKEAKEKFVPGSILHVYEESGLFKIDQTTKEGEFICIVGATNNKEATLDIAGIIANELKIYIQNDIQSNEEKLDDESDEGWLDCYYKEEEEVQDEETVMNTSENDNCSIEGIVNEIENILNQDLELINNTIDSLLVVYKTVSSNNPDDIKVYLVEPSDDMEDKYLIEFVYKMFGKRFSSPGCLIDNYFLATTVYSKLLNKLGIII